MSQDNDFDLELENISLESILAEYKGSAYIDGDKKTPSDILDAKTEKIVMEVTGARRSEAGFSVPENGVQPESVTPDAADNGDVQEQDEKSRVYGFTDADKGFYAAAGAGSILRRMREIDERYDSESGAPVKPVESAGAVETPKPAARPVAELAREPERQPQPIETEPDPIPAEFFERDEKAAYTYEDESAPSREPRDEGDGDAGEKPLSLLERIRRLWNDDDDDDDEEEYEGEPAVFIKTAEQEPVVEPVKSRHEDFEDAENAGYSRPRIYEAEGEDEPELTAEPKRPKKEPKPRPEPKPEPVYEEPNLKEAGRRFAQKCNDVSLKSFIAVLISVVMGIMTFVIESGASLPFGIGASFTTACAVLIIMQLLVIALCIRIAVRGAMDLIKLEPGAESLLLVSALVTIASGALSICKPEVYPEMPLCAVSAFAFAFALWGEKLQLKGITESLKTAAAASDAFGVTSEHSPEIDRVVLRKTPGKLEGFYNSLVAADISETAYKVAAPLIAAGALILAFLASVGHSRPSYFLHIFALLLAAGASFSALIAYAAPFAAIARRARRSGAAVAGWGGADDIYYSDGVCVKDEDVFPTGTLSIEGLKIYEDVSPEKAIRYTASLIIASDSGLSKLFSSLLSQQGLSIARVEDFQCYEGGIGGLIKGERVITGTAAFMNLMGIRVPESMNMKNSAFTAVNDRLVAVFAINYVPINSVQHALVSLLRSKVRLFFASRDFNLTTLMLEQKFKTPLEGVDYLSVHDSYAVSADSTAKGTRAAAVLCREGLGPFGEAITGGRRLRMTALIATTVSVAAAAFGVLLMFFLCWKGAFASARAGNLLLYMLLTLLLDVIVTAAARYRK